MANINWKQVGAAIASALTILAALPYSLGDIATIVPVEWKPRIVTVGILASILLRIWNAAKPTSPPEPTPEQIASILQKSAIQNQTQWADPTTPL